MTMNDVGVQLRRRFRKEDTPPTDEQIAAETRVLESRLRWGPVIHLEHDEDDRPSDEIEKTDRELARA